MKLPQFNFHRRIGLKPGFGVYIDHYGAGTVLTLHIYWSALTLTW